MSEKEGNTVHVKLLINKSNNRVILAEAGQDFVDILYSFLTLPLGTILRLVRKQPSSPSAIKIGCFNNLYESVENLPTEFFRTEACKRMLLCPRNVRAEECRKLEVNLDGSEKLKYFICSDVTCGAGNSGRVSYYDTARCICGKLMDREIRADMAKEEALKGSNSEGGVFFVSDNLNLCEKSATAVLAWIHFHGIKYISQLEERVVKVGFEEVLSLLKNSLTSKTALTDTFLRKQKPSNTTLMDELPYSSMPKEINVAPGNLYLTVKLMRRKSTRKVFYAEVSAEFVDLLFTFLTIPLFSALLITEANTYGFPGCITNLLPMIVNAKSWQVRGVLPPLYSCHPLLPNILPRKPPAFRSYCERSGDNETIIYLETDSFPLSPSTNENKQILHLLDPKSPNEASSEASNSVGYAKGGSRFLVWDDLAVKPLNLFSPVSLLKELDGPFDDIENIEVSIGQQEALCLLRESLFTSSALASLLNFMCKDPKQEKH